MDRGLAVCWRALALPGEAERIAGVFLIALMVVTITIQVVTRYAFGQPLVWVEELATYSFIWPFPAGVHVDAYQAGAESSAAPSRSLARCQVHPRKTNSGARDRADSRLPETAIGSTETALRKPCT